MRTNYQYSFISSINPNEPASWKSKIFLSFDSDWANDEVILDSYNLVHQHSVKSTWFITNKSAALEILEHDNLVELGIHPNFNKLLNNVSLSGDSESVLQELLSFVPRARSVRSHSLTQNERLLDLFSKYGLTHISNLFVPYNSGIKMKPFYLWDNTTIIPHCWQDNVALKMDTGFPNNQDLIDGFYVFDFHPIHIFLNTENLDRYEKTRSLHQNPKELIKHRYKGYGTRNRLIELLEGSKKS